jgi:hypothetical protein
MFRVAEPPATRSAAQETLAGTNMSNSDQSYNALQAVLQKRMSNGLEAQVSYTWSKCMSNSPGYFGTGWGSTGATSSGGQPGWENIYNPRLDWGPCYYDQTNILSSYVTYALPLGRGKQFGHDMNPALNAALGNWEIGGIVTLHSGNALTLNNFGGWGLAAMPTIPTASIPKRWLACRTAAAELQTGRLGTYSGLRTLLPTRLPRRRTRLEPAVLAMFVVRAMPMLI